MKVHRRSFWLFFGILCFFHSEAQQVPNLGVPSIINFSKQEYNAGTQNWDFTQDENGVIYIANNEGLLSYDGSHWQKYPLPNKTIVRSVAVTPDTGKILVGGQDEVGYFQKNKRGFLEYHSIKELAPANSQTMADIWTIFSYKKGVYFISLNILYYYNGKEMRVHPDGDQFLFVGKGREKVVVQKVNGQVYLLEDELNLQEIGRLEFEIVSISELGDNILIATEKNGVYVYSKTEGIRPWKNLSDSFLRENRINKILVQDNMQIVIPTVLGGLLILDQEGVPLYKIDKEAGLQNNMVRSIFEDQDHNLWLGLDNGIDYLSIASPIRFFYPDGKLEGTSYDIEIMENEIYIGTSTGLYRSQWKSHFDPFQSRNHFEKIPGSEGQVWGLNKIGNQIFMGHHEGAFLIKNGNLQKISPNAGYWMFIQDPHSNGRVLAGSYNGLHEFELTNSENWAYVKHYSNFTESSRFISASEEGDYWVSHPYRGIYKISMGPSGQSSEVRRYGQEEGLPSDKGNFAFKVWNSIVVCTEEGIYQYDSKSDAFFPYHDLNDILGEHEKVRRLFEDSRENLWYITQEKIGFLEIVDKGLQKEVRNHELYGLHGKLMGGFELIYPYDSANVFLGSEKGMIHINAQQIFSQKYHFQTLLNEIHLIKDQDSLIFANQINNSDPEKLLVTLPNKGNSFRFSFTATNFSPFHQISYQYKLDGFDEQWSSWSENNSREYTNLSPGKYTFMVRSGIPDVYTTNTANFSFYIDHPWYATPLAYGIYSFIFLAGIAGLVWVPRRRFEKEKALLEEEKEKKVAYHRAEVKQSKEQLMALKNEKLNAEIEHKNKELASTTMHLLQKSELLQKLKTELDRLRTYTNNPEAKKELKRIIGLLNDDSQLDEEWEQFFLHFDRVHSDFFKRLKERFPELTAKDQKMCAYLRMNLSTKEIAPLMNISVRGVEISRYRLRKKLDLDTNINLNEFMMEF